MQGTLTQDAPAAAARSPIWSSIDRLIDADPPREALQRHGIVPLAIERWRASGRPIPSDLLAAERAWRFAALSVRGVLTQVRAAYDGPIVVFKGPTAAARYPHGARSYGDIDLLVEDAAAAQRALLAEGFIEVDEPDLFADIHHLRPLRWEGLPLDLELHSRPKWPDRLTGPRFAEIRDAAVDAGLGVDGILTPCREHHTMLLVAHGWAHSPLRSVRDLLDVAAMAEGLDRRELDELARRWDLERVWATTAAAIDYLAGERARKPAPLRIWAGHLGALRDQTVLEAHLDRWVGAYWGLPFGEATAEGFAHLKWDLRPAYGERSSERAARAWLSLRRAFVAQSEHERELGEIATRRDLRRVIRERRAAERP